MSTRSFNANAVATPLPNEAGDENVNAVASQESNPLLECCKTQDVNAAHDLFEALDRWPQPSPLVLYDRELAVRLEVTWGGKSGQPSRWRGDGQ